MGSHLSLALSSCCHSPKLPAGAERLRSSTDVTARVGGSAATLFPATCRSNAYEQVGCCGGRKNRNNCGAWELHGAEIKEPLNSCFYREDMHILSCPATQGEQSLGSGNQKMDSFPREKALQTFLSASPSPTRFSCAEQRQGYQMSHKIFLKLFQFCIQFYFDNTCGSTHCL